jgi:hypothetical protein
MTGDDTGCTSRLSSPLFMTFAGTLQTAVTASTRRSADLDIPMKLNISGVKAWSSVQSPKTTPLSNGVALKRAQSKDLDGFPKDDVAYLAREMRAAGAPSHSGPAQESKLAFLSVPLLVRSFFSS